MAEIMNDLPNNHFINAIINKDLAEGKYDCRVHTRFPPEPNGYWPCEIHLPELWYSQGVWRPLQHAF